MTNINYEEHFMHILYHYLAEIYVISNKEIIKSNENIIKYTELIKKNYKYKDIIDIKELIELIEDKNDLQNFKQKLIIL